MNAVILGFAHNKPDAVRHHPALGSNYATFTELPAAIPIHLPGVRATTDQKPLTASSLLSRHTETNA
jgi:hypothetical protein